ncbi:GtrA family protein [Novilysobacter avium]|uniref:GtrA family protein n=1 Tax=Novilysobacter avium TaxID=2781023 RepID=UPI001D167516|nr:GtrA family protein [Lysobacter avium]
MIGRALFKQGVSFLLSGGFNTAATFGLYWLLLLVVGYQAAYAISFVAGIALGYVLNTRFVFQTIHSWKKLALYPLVYLISYAVGAGVLALAVAKLGIDEWLAPLISACVTLPLTFFLSRAVLLPRSSRTSEQ